MRIAGSCSGPAVVPAHAGVIPGSGHPTGRDRGRPRTRGGHPDHDHGHDYGAGSSPHTRGSSPSRADQLRVNRVVPAHAGVIRRRWRYACLRASRPRTRGGHPSWSSVDEGVRGSSPHTRGSSVVGAEAGEDAGRRPRTRGGHPPLRDSDVPADESSPHTRGSSSRGTPPCRRWPVVPAHAGVIRGVPPGRRPNVRRPRTRGGHPRDLDAELGILLSSPHTRGSSSPEVLDTAKGGVVPAHAGVIRLSWASRGLPQRRPRTRGGHPVSAVVGWQHPGSSPHTRGSSRLEQHGSHPV